MISHSTLGKLTWEKLQIVPFHNDFFPSGEQPEQRELAHNQPTVVEYIAGMLKYHNAGTWSMD